jgi:16S rRNA (adenine1518-N6/adenine1519-N6)-dimethyltransferase
VDSAVVRMLPLQDPPQIAVRRLSEIVQVAFSQRRKLMRHTLGKWLELHQYGGSFDLQRRAEEVPVHEYVELAASSMILETAVDRSESSGNPQECSDFRL